MKSRRRIPFWIYSAASLFLFTGCQAAATPSPTVIWTMIPTDTPTLTPTNTNTPTSTPTITVTSTSTPTLTPTSPYNSPGTYWIYKCVYYLKEPVYIQFCVNTVNVRNDFTMQFNVRWEIYTADYYTVTRDPDNDNPNIFLEDNLGNRYKHTAVGGCAAETAVFHEEGICSGWFLFPAAEPGATSFRFYDFNYKIYVDGIVLLPKDYPTLEPTSTPNPNLKYNEPGKYFIYKCKSYPPIGKFIGAESVTFCINTVVVDEDRTMKFYVNWKVVTTGDFIKSPDANNPNIFLTDNLGNKYSHIQTGGCAATEFRFYNPGNDCNGWFVFPAAKSGSTSFVYNDTDACFYLDGIILAKQ